MSQLLFGPALEAEIAYHREILDAAYHRRSVWSRLHDRASSVRAAHPLRHHRSARPDAPRNA